MEIFIEDGSNNSVLRYLVFVYLICAFGSLRVGNVPHCWIPHQFTDVEILTDFIDLDKNQKTGKRVFSVLLGVVPRSDRFHRVVGGVP